MTFAHPRDEHERAQRAVRDARDELHAVRERAAAGRATPADVATAEDALDTALERLQFVQAELPTKDGATA